MSILLPNRKFPGVFNVIAPKIANRSGTPRAFNMKAKGFNPGIGGDVSFRSLKSAPRRANRKEFRELVIAICVTVNMGFGFTFG